MSPTRMCKSVRDKGVPLLIPLLLRITLLNILLLSISTSVVTMLPLRASTAFS